MNELERIAQEAARLEGSGSPYLLATVVRVIGSSYRRPGARMLVSGERWIAGCVSGGCLEDQVLMRGAHRCRSGPVVATYDSSEDSEVWQQGLGCNGIVELLLEHVEAGKLHAGLAFARACFTAERGGTLVSVVRSCDERIAVGTRLASGPGSELLTAPEDAALRDLLESAASGPAGCIELPERGLTLLVERIAPSPRLFLLGGGHDSPPIARLAQSVGMRVTVADRVLRDPACYPEGCELLSTKGDQELLAARIDAAYEALVVIKHHQRDADREALRSALASRAQYIGLLGPQRRSESLLAELGASLDDDERLHAPVGLDIGAETPEQIALAIVSEIQALRQKRPGGVLRSRKRSLHASLAIAVLAGGASRRLGRPKQLVDIDGAPLLRRIASTAIRAGAGPVAVVLGAHAEAVRETLRGLPLTTLLNEEWSEGIASSIRAGVRWAERSGAEGLALVLGDQPLLDVAHLSELRDAWLRGADLVGSRFSGIVGAPAVFARERWGDLLALEGDQGAARLLRGALAIDWAPGSVDLDTEEDLRRLPERTSRSFEA